MASNHPRVGCCHMPCSEGGCVSPHDVPVVGWEGEHCHHQCRWRWCHHWSWCAGPMTQVALSPGTALWGHRPQKAAKATSNSIRLLVSIIPHSLITYLLALFLTLVPMTSGGRYPAIRPELPKVLALKVRQRISCSVRPMRSIIHSVLILSG